MQSALKCDFIIYMVKCEVFISVKLAPYIFQIQSDKKINFSLFSEEFYRLSLIIGNRKCEKVTLLVFSREVDRYVREIVFALRPARSQRCGNRANYR